MTKLIEQIKNLRTRTPFEKTVKDSLIHLVSEVDPQATAIGLEPQIDTEDLSSNLKKDLKAYAEYHGLKVPEPQNKIEYITAINRHLSK